MFKISTGSFTANGSGNTTATCFGGSENVSISGSFSRTFSVGTGGAAPLGSGLSAPVTSPTCTATGSYMASSTPTTGCPCANGNCSKSGAATPSTVGAISGSYSVLLFATRPDPSNPSVTQYQLQLASVFTYSGNYPSQMLAPSNAYKCQDGTNASVAGPPCTSIGACFISPISATSPWLYENQIVGTHAFSGTVTCTNPTTYPDPASCCVNPIPGPTYGGGASTTFSGSITIVSA